MNHKIKIGTPLKVLFLEDNPQDAEVCRELIIDSGYNLYMDITATEKEFESFLSTRKYDVILSDFKLPGFDAFGALRLYNKICPEVPFICVSGTIGDEIAVELLKLGAVDYILKDRLERLPFAIKRAIEDGKEKESRQKAEILLAASEMQYRRLFESAKDGILILNLETGKIVDVNPFLIELLGYEKEEFLEKEIWEIGFFKNIVANKDKFIELLQKKYVRYENLLLETSDGRQIDVEFVSNVYAVNSHKVIQCNIRDITERKQMEAEVKNERDNAQLHFDIAGVMFTTLNKQGEIEKINKKGCEILGYSNADELIGFNWFEVCIPKNMKNEVHTVFKQLMEGKVEPVEYYENPILNKSGIERIIAFHNTVLFDSDSKITGILFSGEDITERKLVEEKLHESEAKLKEAMKIANLGTWEYDVAQDKFEFNDQFYAVLHTTAEREGGYIMSSMQYAKKFVHPDDMALVGVETKKALETTDPNYYTRLDHRIIYADGEMGFFNVNIRILKDSQNRTVKTYGVNQDITERKRAEEVSKQEQALTNAIIDAIPGTFYMLNETGKYVRWNAYQRDEIVGKPDDLVGSTNALDTIHPDDRELIQSKIVNVLANGVDETIEGRVLLRGGPAFQWLLMTGRRMLIDNHPFLIGIGIDITERKLAEDALRRSEVEFRTVWENSASGMRITDENGIVVKVNDAFCKMFGKTKEGLEGKPFSVNYTKEKEKHILLKHQELYSSKKVEPYIEKELKLWNGKIIWAQVTNSFLEIEGKKTLLLGIFADITDRKDAEEEISRMANILEATPDLVGMADLHGNIFYLNQGGKLLIEMNTSEDITKLKISDFHPDDIVQLIMREGLPTAAKKGFWSSETKLLSTTGEEIPILQVILCHKNSKNIITHYSTIARDIRESKRSVEKVQKLSLAVEQSPVSVVITNMEGEIEYVNEKFYELTGYTKEEVKGKNPRILKSDKHSKSFYEELWDTILSGKVWKGEIINKKKNGEIYWESESISPLVNKEGDITHFVAMKEDITEKMKMISELFEAKEKAEEMNRLKTNFIHNMSHELRTPLNGILGFADILISELTDPDQNEMAQGIFTSGKRLSETLNFILDLSEVETNKVELTSRNIAVVPLTINCINSFIKEAEKKNLLLETIIKEKNIYAYLEEQLFRRILYNLLDNSLKFTRQGKIIVEVGKEVSEEKDWLYIKVKDSGIGIAQDKIDIIWDEFRQASEGLSRSHEGAGLGLTISKRAVELMKGNISVESELGVGSTFTVKFPSVKVIPSDEKVIQTKQFEAAPLIKENADKKSLPLALYVEDDYSNRNVVKLYLKNTCIVETAEDGETALQLVAEKKFDLILMDIGFPGGINGMEVVREILKMPEYASTPIIAVTAYAKEEDKTEFLKGGCTHYISKPFDKKELVNLITSLFNQQ